MSNTQPMTRYVIVIDVDETYDRGPIFRAFHGDACVVSHSCAEAIREVIENVMFDNNPMRVDPRLPDAWRKAAEAHAALVIRCAELTQLHESVVRHVTLFDGNPDRAHAKPEWAAEELRTIAKKWLHQPKDQP